ncbi:hypothetical protein [Altererythrobacter lutimaris]|uniref:DUF4238 domain-containing protein n=1 Tax=Altererythrobacter lutimaris TaxID=2743979 RepID=A0A850H5I4_9SPHN|nr:hypothetical protein [Altererythrobacter lutimaris]NVE94474.1 hypothetical protein [Altererythrobacter lutimaris]
MASSKKHHWWPVGLQSYWADHKGVVKSIDPDGIVGCKKFHNRQIAKKRHGHTMRLKQGVWEMNFEPEFEIDGKVHSIVKKAFDLPAPGNHISDWPRTIRSVFNGEMMSEAACNYYTLDETSHRDLLLLMISLLTRSPACRWRLENIPKSYGLPANEDIGKLNMYHRFLQAKALCNNGLLSLQYFVALHAKTKNFIFGDGFLDSVIPGLLSGSITGRAYVPLTPNLCIYFSTANRGRPQPNFASLSAPNWVIDRINQTTQAYSRDTLFFKGRKPKLSETFTRREYLQLKFHSDSLTSRLDALAGNPSGGGNQA